jgi:hypothetical protein
MVDSTISGTRPERDFDWLSQYLQDARSYHADFVRQVDRIQSGSLFFHYTDLNGLKAIASEHDLWLTNALYCNDEAEIKLGIAVARDQIQLLNTEPGGPTPRKAYLDELDIALSEPPREGVYICCFCEQGDDLSQWRAYGADGNGVSIQIDPNAFVEYTGNHPYGFLAIWNIFYPPDRQQKIMRTALENTYTKFAHLPADQIARKAKDVIDFFVPTFKHHGFDCEKEWRMIFVPSLTSPVKPRYRAKRDMLIPYFSLRDLILSLGTVKKEDWRLPIRQVCIGPSRHRELNRACAQSLLTDSGYNYPAIASETPYRS